MDGKSGTSAALIATVAALAVVGGLVYYSYKKKVAATAASTPPTPLNDFSNNQSGATQTNTQNDYGTVGAAPASGDAIPTTGSVTAALSSLGDEIIGGAGE